MKKMWVLMGFFLLHMLNSRTMEHDSNSREKLTREDSTKIEAMIKHLPFFPVHLSDEIMEKIFKEVNFQSPQEVIDLLSAIIIEERICATLYDEARHFYAPSFIKITKIIKNAPAQSYTRIALWLTLNNHFNWSEKLHFLSVMLMNKELAFKQKLILAFLAQKVLSFTYINIHTDEDCVSVMRQSTRVDDLKNSLLRVGNRTKNNKIILSFLQNSRITIKTLLFPSGSKAIAKAK